MRTDLPIRPVVIAHRGASGYLPEHTLPAKALAYAMGADYLEQDIVATKDGELIVVHDAVLDRTTNVAELFPDRARSDGRYYALDFTMDEVRTLHAHERTDADGNPVYPDRYPLTGDAFRVHTLAEELQFIRQLQDGGGRPVGVYPEIKHPETHHEAGVDITQLVLDCLHENGYTGRDSACYLQCFDDQELRRVRHDLGSELRLVQLLGSAEPESGAPDYGSMLTADGLQELARTVDGIGPRIEDLYKLDGESGKTISSGLVERAHAEGLSVHPYTLRRDSLPPGVSEFDTLLRFLSEDLRIDGAFTDFPDLVASAWGKPQAERKH